MQLPLHQMNVIVIPIISLHRKLVPQFKKLSGFQEVSYSLYLKTTEFKNRQKTRIILNSTLKGFQTLCSFDSHIHVIQQQSSAMQTLKPFSIVRCERFKYERKAVQNQRSLQLKVSYDNGLINTCYDSGHIFPLLFFNLAESRKIARMLSFLASGRLRLFITAAA